MMTIEFDDTDPFLFEDLNTDYFRKSTGPVERYDSGTDKLNAHDNVVGRLGTQCERVRRIPLSDGVLAERTPAVQKMTQELVNPDRSGRIWSSRAGCHLGKKIIVPNAVSRRSVNEPSRPCPSLLSHCRKPVPEDVNMD